MNRRKITNIEFDIDENNLPIIKITGNKPISKYAISLIEDEFKDFMFYDFNSENKKRLLSNLANTLCFEGKRLYTFPQGFNFSNIEWFEAFENEL